MAAMSGSSSITAAKVQSAPNLFVIGAARSGTTTLYDLLRQHPQIYMSRSKEPRFFNRDSNYRKGADWYLRSYFRGAENYAVRGEATPAYLFLHEKTAPRINDFLNGRRAKFIAILRNPVDRAYSHYWLNRNTKLNFHENLSFEAALANEEARIASDPEFYQEGLMMYAYFRSGLYANQVPSFIRTFGGENCLLLLFEDLYADKFSSTVQRIESFLAVDQFELVPIRTNESMRLRNRTLAGLVRDSRALRAIIAPFIPANSRSTLRRAITDFNAVPFKYPEMNAQTRKMLVAKYHDSLVGLEKILDRDLSAWRQ